MKPQSTSQLDRTLAKVCQRCPVCRTARRNQRGLAFAIVKSAEAALCPFCQAYERVHGRKAHEAPVQCERPAEGGSSSGE